MKDTEVKDIKATQPEEVKENPDTTIKKLQDELNRTRQVAEQAINENQILRATVKALSQLI